MLNKGLYLTAFTCNSDFPTYLGSTKHNITLTGQDDAQRPTVKDLSDALTKATGVPQNSQKIIFKGRL